VSCSRLSGDKGRDLDLACCGDPMVQAQKVFKADPSWAVAKVFRSFGLKRHQRVVPGMLRALGRRALARDGWSGSAPARRASVSLVLTPNAADPALSHSMSLRRPFPSHSDFYSRSASQTNRKHCPGAFGLLAYCADPVLDHPPELRGYRGSHRYPFGVSPHPVPWN